MTVRSLRGPPVRLILVVTLMLSAGVSHANPSSGDLEAISHTLGFVEGIPHVGKIRVGVVYESVSADGAAIAQETADALSATAGPGSTVLVATTVPADAIASAPGDLNVLLLMPGIGKATVSVIDEARRRHLLTVSSDPQCLADHSCVLWVQTEPHVAVTLDTALADDLSVRISPIFAMMVKRK